MLVRLIYSSRAATSVTHDELSAIFKKSRTHNAAAGITGLLCFCDGSRGFLQVLEGGRQPVNALYNRIAQDERHTEVQLLAYDEIAERRFAGWSMGQVLTARLNPGLVLKYAETAALDPRAMTGKMALALFDELVATASIVGQG